MTVSRIHSPICPRGFRDYP